MRSHNCFFKIFKKDIVSIDEIYEICNKKPDGNKFIKNKLTGWKKKGLVEPLYGTGTEKGAYKTLLAVELTEHGALYFGRTLGRELTLVQIFDAVAQLQRQHSHFDIQFEIKLKEGL